MSGSELSLRHLPDLSDASFSFQIPTDSSDDLLRADSTDFFGGPGSLLGSPSRTNDAPLTLSDLTPLPKATAGLYGSTPVQKATKSLLPTTRSNIQDLTVSQIASKVPKPISSHRKRKELVNVADATALETPVTTTKPLSKRSTSSQSPSENLTMTAAGVGTPRVETQPSAIDKLPPIDEKADPSNIPVDEEIVAKPASIPNETVPSNDTALTEGKEDTPVRVHVSYPVETNASLPAEAVAKAPSKSKKVTASSAIAKTKAPTSRPKPPIAPVKSSQKPAPVDKAELDTHPGTTNNEGSGIAARLLMYGEQMMASFPPSDSDDTPQTAAKTPVESHEMVVEPCVSGAELLIGAGDACNAVSETVLSDGQITETDNRMVVDSEPHTPSLPESELGLVASHDGLVSPPGTATNLHARDDPLTLSQLSPRKIGGAISDGEGNTEKTQRSGAVSPMRPSAKRPASAAPVDPMVRSKKRAPAAPRVPSIEATRPARGRGGRTVSAPSQVRRQPTRKARDAPAQAMLPPPANSTRARIASASTNSAPSIKNKREKLPIMASSSSGKNPGPRNTTVPVEFNFQGGARVSNSDSGVQLGGVDGGETQARPKGYTIPDFKAMHASQAAQSALRRSQLAPTVPVPIAFNTDMRAKERELFDERLREREREMEAAREVQRREREEEEAKELRELRKRAIPKAHEVPEWYKEAPRKNHGAGQ